MYARYCAEHLNPASYGTFLGLRPFYVRSATTKDIEMCVCKKHSHARWGVDALVRCAAEQTSYLEVDPLMNRECVREREREREREGGEREAVK